MKILVFGLGYVGTTMIACLLEDGHTVAGIDVSEIKVNLIRDGRSPIVEPGVAERLAEGVRDGRLSAAMETGADDHGVDMVVACVGTPSKRDGGLNLSQVKAAAGEIGMLIRRRSPDLPPMVVVFRSTMPPGTMEELVLPGLREAAGEMPGDRYEVAFNPEFLREGTAIQDYRHPPKIVIGERFPGATGRLRGLYDGIDAPLFEVGFSEAEFVKFADNSYHATKVVFANEIGRLCLEHGVDPQKVMDIFLADTKLNVSPYYLRPGGAFGGSCLPKDVMALVAEARRMGLRAPMLEALMPSNDSHKEYLTRRVLSAVPPGARILQIGLTFKSGTDDLRESPLVYLAHTLIEEGYRLSIYEPEVAKSTLLGANLKFAQDKSPALWDHLVPTPADAGRPDLIVVGKPVSEPLPQAFKGVPRIDLHRLSTLDAGRPLFRAEPPAAKALP